MSELPELIHAILGCGAAVGLLILMCFLLSVAFSGPQEQRNESTRREGDDEQHSR